MDERLVYRRLIALLVLAVAAAWPWVVPYLEGDSSVATLRRGGVSPYLQVHFLDVGQGDAILIETPDGVQALIDGGPDGTVIRELGKVMGVFDKSIDVVVGTHPDKDHIGGLTDVLERYKVVHIVKTDNVGETGTAKLYESLVGAEGADVIYAKRGQQIALGASTTLEILYPEGSVRDLESNTSSIVLKVVYGDTSFMLTGDSPKNIEEYLVLTEGEHLKSTVLKAGHHGSRTSTSELWLAEVAPEYAVISAGKDNSYGHPHVEVTDALFNAGVKTLSTAEQGMITFDSDGEKVWVE